MSWKDELFPASFRGVPFYIERSEAMFGRRTLLVERWGRDTPDVHDYGGKAQEFRVEGYIIQNASNDFNYFPNKNALIKAIEKKDKDKRFGKGGTAGELIHPFYGKMKVRLKEPARVTEDIKEGGIVKFDMEFVQFFDRIKLSDTKKDPVNQVDSSVTKALVAVNDEFGGQYNGTSFSLSDISTAIKSVMSSLQQAMAKVRGAISSVINGALSTLSAVISGSANFLQQPCQMYSQLKGASDAFKNIVGMGDDLLNYFEEGKCSGEPKGEEIVLDGSTVPEEVGDTAVRALLDESDFTGTETALGDISSEQENNMRAVTILMRSLLLSTAFEIVVRVEYSSQNQIFEIMKVIDEKIDSFLEFVGDTDVETIDPSTGLAPATWTDTFQAFLDLKSQILEAMQDKASGLANSVIIDTKKDLQSALQLAYDKYEDLDRMAEVFWNNREVLDNPAFITRNTLLEVLDE